MNTEIIIDNFKMYLLEKGFSKSSIQLYPSGLSSFLSFLHNNDCDYLEFNENDVENYSLNLSGTNQSINAKLFSVKKYCEYLNEKGLSKINFQANFKKIKKRDINLISDKSFNKIIDFIENNSKNDLIRLRDILVFKFLYYLGIRVSDLVKIKKSDLNIKESSLLLDNKELIIDANLLDDLINYIEIIPNNSFIFFSFASNRYNFDNGLTVKSIEDMFNKYIKIIGNNYTIIDLRNSYSYNNKFSIPVIHKINSHKSISYGDDFLTFIE